MQKTKKCGRCGRRKRADKFYTRMLRGKKQLASYCKPCSLTYKNEWYSKSTDGRQKQIQRTAEAKRALREEVQRLKSSTPCSDCNKKHPYWRMQFDHVDDNKVAEVSRLVSNGAADLVMEEIAKCELVCANCHTDRTHERRQCEGA
jgi:hypothetical protein